MAGSSPPVDVEVLLAHGRFARALARSLVHDDHLAEDLVQEAWIAALKHPPRRGVRAWLRAVLRNLAANVHRGASRRGARERLVAGGEGLPSAEELALRAETLRDVMEAVVALDEPYRTTVLLRFYEDLSSADIARRLEIPPSTVRNRLRRALDALRGRLDARHGSDRRAWTVVLLPLAGSAPEAPPHAAASPGPLGGLLMAKKALAAGAALLLLVGGAGFLLLHERAGRLEDGGRATATPLASAPPGARPASRPAGVEENSAASPGASGPAREDEPTAPRVPETAWELRGRLVGFDAAVAGGPAVLSVRAITTVDGPPPPALLVETTGAFDADVTSLANANGAVELELGVDLAAYLPASTRVPLGSSPSTPAGEKRTLAADLRLVRAAPIRGRVVDEAGRAVEGAIVAAFPVLAERPDGRSSDRASSGPDGGFDLRLVPGDRYLVAAARAGLRPATAEARGGTSDLVPLVLRKGASLAGTVRWNGAPLAGARVEVRPARMPVPRLALGALAVAGTGLDATLEHLEVIAGEDGTYRALGLPEGPCRVSVRGPREGRFHPDVSEWLERTVEAPAKAVDFDVETARVVLEVRTGDRQPEDVSAAIDGTTPEEESIDLGIRGDADGLAAFDARPGADYEVKVGARGFLASTRRVTAPAAGGESRERFDLEPESAPSRSLRILLRGEGAESLGKASAAFFAPGQEGLSAEISTRPLDVKDGRLEVADPPPGRWRLVVRPGGPWNGNTAAWLDAETDVEVPEGGDLDVELPLRPGGRLRVSARDPEGRFLQARCEIRDGTGRRVPVRFTTQHGEGNWSGHSGALGADAPAVVEPALPPGTYRVDLRHDGYLDRSEEVRVEPGRWKDLDITLERR